MIRWGIIGSGDISSRVVADLRDMRKDAAVAVWGRRRERAEAFAAEHAIPFSTVDRGELLARPDIDIVYIATPADTHFEIALEALHAGKHVLVEKPMATSAADVAQIFDHAASVGRFAMEAMWMRFNPLHVELRARILGGELGEVRSLRASFGTPFHPRGDRLTPAQGGSILLDRGIYPVTLAHWFLGEPDSVTVNGTAVEGVDVSGHATLEYRGDRFAQLAWSGVEFLDLSASVSGERGWMTIDPMFWAGSTARVHAGSVERIFSTPEVVEHPRSGNGYGPMLVAVEAAITAGRLQHPDHDRTATVAVATTLDLLSTGLQTSDGAPR